MVSRSVLIITGLRLAALREAVSPDFTYSYSYLSLLSAAGAMTTVICCTLPMCLPHLLNRCTCWRERAKRNIENNPNAIMWRRDEEYQRSRYDRTLQTDIENSTNAAIWKRREEYCKPWWERTSRTNIENIANTAIWRQRAGYYLSQWERTLRTNAENLMNRAIWRRRTECCSSSQRERTLQINVEDISDAAVWRRRAECCRSRWEETLRTKRPADRHWSGLCRWLMIYEMFWEHLLNSRRVTTSFQGHPPAPSCGPNCKAIGLALVLRAAPTILSRDICRILVVGEAAMAVGAAV